MDTAALRWFQLVADGLTVTEVSEMAHITQPGVSRALARLEADVGTPLLAKNGRVLRMTQAGAAFKRHVDALLHQLDDGLAAVSQLIDPETGTVAIATQRSFGTWLVPNLVRTFHAEHPDVRFELRQERDELEATTLSEGRLDLEITTIRPADRTVRWYPLLVEPLWLAVPLAHPLSTRAAVELADVAGESFIRLRGPSLLWRQCEALCREAGFTPRVDFEGDDIPTLRAFVAAGLGVAIVPAPRVGSMEAPDPTVCHLPLIDPGASREIGLGWSVEQRLLPSAALFRQHIIDRAAAGELPRVAASPRA